MILGTCLLLSQKRTHLTFRIRGVSSFIMIAGASPGYRETSIRIIFVRGSPLLPLLLFYFYFLPLVPRSNDLDYHYNIISLM
jgi:hypothetical protein